MSLYTFEDRGWSVWIEDNEDRAGQFAHVETQNGRKWGTLHCLEATGEWSGGMYDDAGDAVLLTASELRHLDMVRGRVDKIMAENGWEE